MIVLGTAWLCPVCGGFDQTNYIPLNWSFPVDTYNGTYVSGAGHGTSDNIRSAIGRSDKRYWELTVNTATTSTQLPYYVGLLLPGSSNILRPGFITGTIGYRQSDGAVLVSGTIVQTYLPYGPGDTPMLAMDALGNVWFGKNGTFNGNPAAGTGAAANLGAATYFAATGVDDTGGSNFTVTGRFLTGSTIYAAPSGFNCWDD